MVYDLVADVARVAQWSPECVKARWLGATSGAAPGARFRATNRSGVVRWSNTCRVVSAEPGQEFAFIAPDPLGRPTTKWTYRLEPVNDGTAVTESFEMLRDLPTYVRVVERVVLGMKDRRALLEENLRTSLGRIKETLERGERRVVEDSTPPRSELPHPGDCLECGFEAASVSKANADEVVRNLGSRYQMALGNGGPAEPADARLRQRPAPGTWSALEYAAHMRDVVALWGLALHRILTEDSPQLPSVDPGLPDRVAAEADYAGQEPATVGRELSANAERMAKKVATIRAEQWNLTAWFGEVVISPLWIVQKVAHEGHHHLLDIERSLASSQPD